MAKRTNGVKLVGTGVTAYEQIENSIQKENSTMTTETVETVTESARAPKSAVAVYSLTEDVISAAIEAGHLRAVGLENVTIGKKVSPTGKDETQAYEKLQACDLEGMVILSGGKIEPATDKPEEPAKDERTDEQKKTGACDHFNYGQDLAIRQQLRGVLAGDIEGPSKVIAKTAEGLVKAGVFDTQAEAVAFVKEQRTAKGLPV